MRRKRSSSGSASHASDHDGGSLWEEVGALMEEVSGGDGSGGDTVEDQSELDGSEADYDDERVNGVPLPDQRTFSPWDECDNYLDRYFEQTKQVTELLIDYRSICSKTVCSLSSRCESDQPYPPKSTTVTHFQKREA